jgi:hypothetical protein
MNSWLSILPKGFFGLNKFHHHQTVNGVEPQEAASLMLVDENERKRVRTIADDEDSLERPVKRFRGIRGYIAAVPSLVTDASTTTEQKPKTVPSTLDVSLWPEDVVAHCLLFLNGVNDRFALQTTCKQFKRISDSDAMRKDIMVGGDKKTGLFGIIDEETDTPESASAKLEPFARAGNLEAIYM